MQEKKCIARELFFGFLFRLLHPFPHHIGIPPKWRSIRPSF
jgi:hypothetical protein